MGSQKLQKGRIGYDNMYPLKTLPFMCVIVQIVCIYLQGLYLMTCFTYFQSRTKMSAS